MKLTRPTVVLTVAAALLSTLPAHAATLGSVHGSGSLAPSSRVVASATPRPIGIPGEWTLTWSDEFNGTRLDTTKWRPGWFNATGGRRISAEEAQGYSSANVTEPGDGYLHLRLSRLGAVVSSNPHDGRPSGGFEFTGTAALEARIYTPGAGSRIANWPAWWTDGQVWPKDGEIDVMEGLGGQACYHTHTPSGAPGGCVTAITPGWHTYGAMWNPSAHTVTFYYDGVRAGSTPFRASNAPQYLLFDNTSSATLGYPTVRNRDLLIDYVRVWK